MANSIIQQLAGPGEPVTRGAVLNSHYRAQAQQVERLCQEITGKADRFNPGSYSGELLYVISKLEELNKFLK
jgi:hypothetical protein